MWKNSNVEAYFQELKQWRAELELLRAIVLECGLTEEWKWRAPCYTYRNGNVILLASFKDHCAISFVKGVLLSDTNKILQKPGENSQSVKLIRFTQSQEIIDLKATLKTYVFEAIEVEKAGLKVDFKEKDALVFPEELLQKLESDPAFKTAFEALTPGKQRGYNLYFSAAKQSPSRTSRIEKYTQRILDGFGFHDCVCGQSKKFPRCDGSHKLIQ